MPLGPGVRYRYKKGTKMRLAFKGKKVVEVKNMATGDVSHPDHQDLKGEVKSRYAKRSRRGL